MIRWHAELHIGKVRTCPTVPDAIFSSVSKSQALGGILNYVFTMVKPDEPFHIIVKPTDTMEQQ